jgi:enoyl-CoA hydratase/carnithine racemase
MAFDVSRLRTKFEDYAEKYQTNRMQRDADGVLEMTLHTNGDSLRWGRLPHAELEECFLNVGRDRGNKVIILTGTGEEFSGPAPESETNRKAHHMNADDWGELGWEAKGFHTNLLAIEVPMISAINGPALRHAELPVMCDIVLASETAAFQDSAHFVGGLVPGDGVHVVFPLAMGLVRGRYFLLTGQRINAQEAKEVGLVSEVLPRDKLLPRARELAQLVLKQPELNRRYARVCLTEQLRRQFSDLLPYGLALEGLAITRE